MMYKWTPDMIRFMDDASSNSDYFKVLAETVFKEAGNAENVCDAGCGLGQLAVELKKYYPAVCGIDINRDAIDFFKNKAAGTDIKIINADMLTYSPEKKFDLMVFNYFGDIKDILKIRERCCCGKTVIVKRSYTSHRFSFENKPINSFNRQNTVDYLKQSNITFREIPFSHEFGQPFRSIDDALLFFNTYSRDTDRSLINRDNILTRITETDNTEFPYYMQHVKESSIIIL